MKTFKKTHDFATFERRQANGDAITTTPRELIFSVKSTVDDETPLIQKTMSNGDIIHLGNGVWQVQLIPKDTEKMAFGRYVCDVKVIDEYGLEFIIVPAQEFKLLDTVTLVGG